MIIFALSSLSRPCSSLHLYKEFIPIFTYRFFFFLPLSTLHTIINIPPLPPHYFHFSLLHLYTIINISLLLFFFNLSPSPQLSHDVISWLISLHSPSFHCLPRSADPWLVRSLVRPLCAALWPAFLVSHPSPVAYRLHVSSRGMICAHGVCVCFFLDFFSTPSYVFFCFVFLLFCFSLDLFSILPYASFSYIFSTRSLSLLFVHQLNWCYLQNTTWNDAQAKNIDVNYQVYYFSFLFIILLGLVFLLSL